MLNKHVQASSQKGFSLVELLVALALSTALMAGVIEVYLENKRNFVQNEEYARMQENGRYALSLLKREVTMSGFYGGNPDVSDLTASVVSGDCVAVGFNWALDLSASIELANNVTASGSVQTVRGDTTNTSTTFQNTCIVASELQAGSDVFVVKRTADTATLENGALNAAEDDSQWYLRTEEYGTNKGWTYLAAGGEIPATDKSAGSKVDYWKYYAKIFFLQDYSRAAGDGIPSFCVESLQQDGFSKECFVEGIEDLQIEVGIDTDGDSYANQYVAAPTAAQMEEAVSVRLHILVRSINEIQGYTNSKTYVLGSKSTTVNDGYLRQVYSSTVLLRNEQLGI